MRARSAVDRYLTEAVRPTGGPGRDMKITYPETARGGLAVHVIEC